MTSFDLQHLLVHDRFVRSIARALLSPSDAEDAVQETWLRAATRPPREVAAARPWLARVVTNVTRSMRRREGTRERADLRALAQEPVPGPDAILERESLRREIVLAVLALDAPYRDAIVLRYFEGLEPRECAERLSIPLNTYLSRAHRARLSLKEQFTDADGKPRFSFVAMSALASPSRMKTPTLIASSLLRTVALSLLAVAGSLGVWIAFYSQAVAPQSMKPPTTTVAQAISAEPTSGPVVEPAPVLAPTRSVVEDVPAIHGVVTDDTGRRLAGARVTVHGPGGWIESATDSQGAFVLQLPRAATVDLRVDSKVHFATEFLGASAGDSIAAVLRPAVPFHGRVVDAESGDPIAGAALEIGRRIDHSPATVAKTDENGEFGLLAPPRAVELKVTANGYAQNVVRPFSPSSENAYELRLSREPSRRLGYVRVRDAEHGPITDFETIPGPLRVLESGVVEVGIESVATGAVESKVLSTKVDPSAKTGSIRFGMRAESSRRTVRIRSRHGPWIVARLPNDSGKDEANPAEVILPRVVALRGVVTSGSPAAPVAGAIVRIDVVPTPDAMAQPARSWPIEVRTGANGNFSSEGLLEGMHVSIEVDHELGRARKSEVVVARGDKPIAIAIDPGSSVIGRVSSGGHPVEGARVTLRPQALQASSLAVRVAWTDSDGRFSLQHVPDQVEMLVAAAGFSAVRTARDPKQTESIVELTAESVVDGKVVDAAGRAVAGATVIAKRSAQTNPTDRAALESNVAFSDGSVGDPTGMIAARTVTDSAGRFLLRALSPGECSVVAFRGAAMSASIHALAHSVGAIDANPIVLRLESPGAVIARVVSASDGAPISAFTYAIESKNDAGAGSVMMAQGHGGFVHLAHEGRVASVRVTGSEDAERIANDLVVAVIARDVDLRDGEWRELTFELPADQVANESTAPLKVSLSVKGRDGAHIALVPQDSGSAPAIRFGLLGHGEIEAKLPAVPAGRYKIEVTAPNGAAIICDPEVVSIVAATSASLALVAR